MKKILFTLLIAFFVSYAYTQELKIENGLYYKKDMLYTGTHIEKYENGNISLEINVRNGLEHGNVDYYFPSGVKKEHREYNDGKKTGIWITWGENNVKLAEAGYKDNIKDGAWFVWDTKGTLLYEMHYSMGKKTGIWKQWDENGTLIMERNYEETE